MCIKCSESLNFLNLWDFSSDDFLYDSSQNLPTSPYMFPVSLETSFPWALVLHPYGAPKVC